MCISAAKWLVAGLLVWFSSIDCQGTEHIFVRNKDGVWLVSDSLWVHNDGYQITHFNRCKVAISRGRLIFDAGHFKDLNLLLSQESALPFASIDATERSLYDLLKTNHMDITQDPTYSPDLLVVNAGIVQVENSEFIAKMIGQKDDLFTRIRFVKKWEFGVPHGLGIDVDQAREEAAHNSVLAAQIAKNPKRELLKLIKNGSVNAPDAIGGPFTVLLLHNDGTVSDFSDNLLCSIPPDAAHLKARSPKRHRP